MTQALNADWTQLLSAASQMRTIAGDVLSALGRYSMMNQNLTGTGFIGDAAMASMATTEDIHNTGRQVSQRFESVIETMEASAHQYQEMNNQNRAALGNIQSV